MPQNRLGARRDEVVGAQRRSSRRSHRDCRREAQQEAVVMDQQSTEEIFLESQRCELELELAALNMIFNASYGKEPSKAQQLCMSGWSGEEEEETQDGAPPEHIPDDEDCASLQAQLEQLRLQISENEISVDERSGCMRKLASSQHKKTVKRARM